MDLNKICESFVKQSSTALNNILENQVTVLKNDILKYLQNDLNEKRLQELNDYFMELVSSFENFDIIENNRQDIDDDSSLDEEQYNEEVERIDTMIKSVKDKDLIKSNKKNNIDFIKKKRYELSKKNVSELKELLKEKNLTRSGKKEDLIQRLINNYERNRVSDDDEDDDDDLETSDNDDEESNILNEDVIRDLNEDDDDDDFEETTIEE